MTNTLKRIRRVFLDMGIRRKVLIIFLLMGTLPFLCYIILSNRYTNRIILERERSLTELALEQAVSSVDNKLVTYNNLSNFMFNNNAIMKVLNTSYHDDYFKMYKAYSDTIEPLFLTYYALYPDLEAITIYSSGDIHPYNNYILDLDSLYQKDWFPQVHNQYIPTWVSAVEDGKPYLYSTRLIGDIRQYKSSNYLSFRINYDLFFEPFLSLSEDKYDVVVTARDGSLIFSTSDLPEEELTPFLTDMSDTQYLKLTSSIPETGWNICYYKTYTSIHSAVNAITRGTYAFGWIILLFLGVMVLIISVSIVTPIEDLTEKIDEVRTGDMNDLSVSLVSERHDEIGTLFHTFSRMMGEINHYIMVNLKHELEKKNYQQKILYAQINPHFLYNSLSLINSRAILSGQNDISEMVILLSTFYRTALNKGKDITTLGNELMNIQAYVKIQLFSYSESIDVVYNIETSLSSAPFPNFILQPLVENALDHGLKNSLKKDKKLTVTVKKEVYMTMDFISIWIEDNGCGMEKEAVDQLFSVQTSGYGMKNVNDRLRLLYGDDYMLTIESEPDRGTTAFVRIPCDMGHTE